MSYAGTARQYRETQVLTASPIQLVVIVYDHLLANLRRAAIATRSGDAEVRSTYLNRARASVNELLVALDRERGGDLARDLSTLYAYFLTELLDQGVSPDAERLERLTEQAATLRGAFGVLAGEDEAE